jgi:putative endonuclease
MPRIAKRHRFCVYLLVCKGNRLYCGQTHDIRERYTAHAEKRGARYTKAHPPLRIGHLEYYPTRSAAVVREHYIKRNMRRQGKLDLIRDTHRLARIVAFMFGAEVKRRKR